LKAPYNLELKKIEKSAKFDQYDVTVLKKIEVLLRLLEKEESKYEKLKNSIKKHSGTASNNTDNLKKLQKEIKLYKKRVDTLQDEINILNQMLDGINRNYQLSAEASVNLLSDLEYNMYKSRFIDIDIECPPSIEKLKKYGKNIKTFFLDDMHCTYIFIHCNGITEDLKNLLHITSVNSRRILRASSLIGHGFIILTLRTLIFLKENSVG
jgi:hypothetical protein